MLSLGSSMLFIHLLDHLAVIHVLNPLVLFNQPTPGLPGALSLLSDDGLGILFNPIHAGTEFFNSIPILKNILAWPLVQKIGEHLRQALPVVRLACHYQWHWHRGLYRPAAAVVPAVALWHNPGVLCCFTVSAFSTAMAFLLLILNLAIKKREEDRPLRVFYERTDLMLIAAELIILFSFFPICSVDLNPLQFRPSCYGTTGAG